MENVELRSEDGGDGMTKEEAHKILCRNILPCLIGEWREAISIATKALEAEPHWIPVTENCDCDLMDNEEVLVFQKDGTINGQIRHAMFYDFNGKKKFVTWEEGITIYDVLAYMPLPEPYKGVTDGND